MANSIKIIVSICIWMFLIHFANILAGFQLNQFGIRPGDTHSLPFIFSAPWLHGSWAHLLNNLMGLTVFGLLSLLRGPKFFTFSSMIIITLTGLQVWAFGRSGAIHIGASGWIFGLWSLSIAIAWFQKSWSNLLIACFVVFFYGGMIWGVLPSDPHVSFESHLFGAISGVIAAYIMSSSRLRQQSK
ncbi:MAG: rhomboid family intramembrane serine protease [Agarilytica sp.]